MAGSTLPSIAPTRFGTATEQAKPDLASVLGPLNSDEGLPNRIADRLAESIISGNLAEGTRLSEPELAVAFKTSRTPVREALRILEREGLVSRAPRRGCRVSVIDAGRAHDIYVCRAYLYGLAAKLACSHLDDAKVEQLAGLYEDMRRTVNARDTAAFFSLNVAFHEEVRAIAHNEVLSTMIQNLGRATMRLRFLSITLPGRLEASLNWHRQLVACFADRDAAGAERVVRAMIAEAGQAVLDLHYHDRELAEQLAHDMELPEAHA